MIIEKKKICADYQCPFNPENCGYDSPCSEDREKDKNLLICGASKKQPCAIDISWCHDM